MLSALLYNFSKDYSLCLKTDLINQTRHFKGIIHIDLGREHLHIQIT